MKHEYSAMYVGDLHGRIYDFEQAIEKFEEQKLDKLVFIGDYVDGGKTNTEVLHLLNQVINYKKENPERVICLLGNHDFQYAYYPNEEKCSGFREDAWMELYKAFSDNKEVFQIAWRNGDYMASHAGILSDWVHKYNDRLGYYEDKFHIDRITNFDTLLNAINETHDRWILNTIPVIRGGSRGSVGGPLWADMSEITNGSSCLHRFTHIVGHNKVKDIIKYQHKGGPTIMFIDCLEDSTNFLTITK